MRHAPILLLLLALAGCGGGRPPASSPGAGIQFLTPQGPWAYPFSPAVRYGNLLFLSGQIGSRTDASGQAALVPGGIDAETRQTMDNIRAVLERNGSSLDRVVRCLVMLADMRDWPRFNEIYATYFPGPKPARSAMGANGLALGARVEVECTAVAG